MRLKILSKLIFASCVRDTPIVRITARVSSFNDNRRPLVLELACTGANTVIFNVLYQHYK